MFCDILSIFDSFCVKKNLVNSSKNCTFAQNLHSICRKVVMKSFLEDTIYVGIWSGGLLYGSFRAVFENKMTYNFHSLSMAQACDEYVFPMLMAMLLFLFDVIYNALGDFSNGRQPRIIGLLICLCVFIGSFIFTLLYDNASLVEKSFWTAWGALTLMKYFSTHNSGNVMAPIASLPNNN